MCGNVAIDAMLQCTDATNVVKGAGIQKTMKQAMVQSILAHFTRVRRAARASPVCPVCAVASFRAQPTAAPFFSLAFQRVPIAVPFVLGHSLNQRTRRWPHPVPRSCQWFFHADRHNVVADCGRHFTQPSFRARQTFPAVRGIIPRRARHADTQWT